MSRKRFEKYNSLIYVSRADRAENAHKLIKTDNDISINFPKRVVKPYDQSIKVTKSHEREWLVKHSEFFIELRKADGLVFINFKNTDTAIKQTKTSPQETLECRLTKSMHNSSLDPPL